MNYLLQITKQNKTQDKVQSGNTLPEFLDIESKQLSSVIKEALKDKTNNVFDLDIVNSDDESNVTKQFSSYNNIKQIILYNELISGRPYSSVKSLKYRLKELDNLEDKYEIPFYEFNEKIVQEYINGLSKKGNSVHTISTKLSLIGKAVNELNQIFKENNLPEIKNNLWKEINSDRKNGTAALREANEKVFITEGKLIKEILPGASLELTIPILLVYKGLMIGNEADEVTTLKWEGFNGNQINIEGERARTIVFTNAEMKFIKAYREKFAYNQYVISVSDYYKNSNLKDRPVKRWTVWNRMASAARELGLSKRTLSAQNIRQSGQLNWILREKVDLYGPYATPDEMDNVIYKSFIQFGETKEDMENMSSATWHNRKTRILLNLEQFGKSKNK